MYKIITKFLSFFLIIIVSISCQTIERRPSTFYDTEVLPTNSLYKNIYTTGQNIQPGGVYLVKENPERGFYWPFLIRIPNHIDPINQIVISTANSGRRSEDFNFDEQVEWAGLHRWLPYIQVMPILDRSARLEDWHGLRPHYLMGTEILHTKWAEHYRVDIQVVEMLKEARRILQKSNIDTYEKYYIYGYSGSAFFATRFVSLHPEIIKAAAYGGHYWTVVPVKEYRGIKLGYNYGVNNYVNDTGKSFDVASFKEIPQFIFMGDKDDPIGPIHWPFEGNPGEVKQSYVRSFSNQFGTSASDLFFSYKEIFEKNGFINANFKLYENANHDDANIESQTDIINFFTEIDRLTNSIIDSKSTTVRSEILPIPYKENNILISFNEEKGNNFNPAADIVGIDVAQTAEHLYIHIKLADPNPNYTAWYQTNLISNSNNQKLDLAIHMNNGKWISELRKIESGSARSLLIDEAYISNEGLIGRIPLTAITDLGMKIKIYSHIFNGREEDQTASKYIELR